MACYYIIGHAAFKRNDFANAIPNLENSIKINNRNDTAYYFLAESYVYAQKPSMAILNYAKASLLGGQVAVPAKQKLENLYKQTHAGSLAGLDKILAVAKSELSK
jgi:predicted Zn-dependent protease